MHVHAIQPWNYSSVGVGCLSYDGAMVCLDLTFAVQLCAHFCDNPQRQHQEAVKHICCYLLKTKDQQGLTFRPNKSCGLECYVDPDYAAIGQMKLPMIPILSTLVHALVIALCMPVVQLFLFPNIKPLWHLARQKQAEYIALSSAL
jgi:hypothetical protein